MLISLVIMLKKSICEGGSSASAFEKIAVKGTTWNMSAPTRCPKWTSDWSGHPTDTLTIGELSLRTPSNCHPIATRRTKIQKKNWGGLPFVPHRATHKPCFLRFTVGKTSFTPRPAFRPLRWDPQTAAWGPSGRPQTNPSRLLRWNPRPPKNSDFHNHTRTPETDRKRNNF